MSKAKKVLCTLLVYIVILIICTIVFILLFHTGFLKKLDVFFYRGCVFLAISGFVSILLTLLVKKMFQELELDIKDILTVLCIFCGVTLAWYTLIPVTVERSISVFMLSYMDQNDKAGITSDEFGKIFYDKYIEDFGAFDKRFNEQIISKNIEPSADGKGYVITNGGRFIVNLFRLCAKMFNTEQWLVYPNDF